MNQQLYDLYVEVCKAIAHPSRMKILDLLRGGELCVCELAPKVGISETNLSQHLALLRKAALVDTRREGHSIYYRVRDPRIFQALDLMGEIVADQLARSASALRAMKA